MNLLTFDCYGTLLNTTPLDEVLTDLGHRYVPEVPGDSFLAEYHRQQQLAMQSAEFHPFHQILTQSLAETLHHFDYIHALSGQETDLLWHTYRDLIPYPEVNAVLSELSHTARLFLLSNSTQTLMDQHCRHFHFPIAGSFLAEEQHCYKPAPAFFQHIHTALKLVHHQHSHISASYDTDIASTENLGWNRIWLNRQHQVPPVNAGTFREIQNLTELL